jgi:hypothetical protein
MTEYQVSVLFDLHGTLVDRKLDAGGVRRLLACGHMPVDATA